MMLVIFTKLSNRQFCIYNLNGDKFVLKRVRIGFIDFLNNSLFNKFNNNNLSLGILLHILLEKLED